MLYPCVVGVACGWDAIDPSFVVLQKLAAPVAVVEGRVGEDKVGPQVGMAVIVEGVAVCDLVEIQASSLTPASRTFPDRSDACTRSS